MSPLVGAASSRSPRRRGRPCHGIGIGIRSRWRCRPSDDGNQLGWIPGEELRAIGPPAGQALVREALVDILRGFDSRRLHSRVSALSGSNRCSVADPDYACEYRLNAARSSAAASSSRSTSSVYACVVSGLEWPIGACSATKSRRPLSRMKRFANPCRSWLGDSTRTPALRHTRSTIRHRPCSGQSFLLS
jgi:hypothetical protein